MNIICCLLKNTSFWHSADEKPISNDLVHAIAGHCMFTLSLYVLSVISMVMLTKEAKVSIEIAYCLANWR